MNLGCLKKFIWKMPKYYCPQCWYTGHKFFHEFWSLVEFPKKCARGIAATSRSPGY